MIFVQLFWAPSGLWQKIYILVQKTRWRPEDQVKKLETRGHPKRPEWTNLEQQYRLFPLPGNGWVGLDSGVEEPVLGRKDF